MMATSQGRARGEGVWSLPRGVWLLWVAVALELASIGVAALAFGPLDRAPLALAIAIPFLFVALAAALVAACDAIRLVDGVSSRRIAWLVLAMAVAQLAGLTWDTTLHSLGSDHNVAAHTLAEFGFVGFLLTGLALTFIESRWQRGCA